MKTQAVACAENSDDWAERGDYWLGLDLEAKQRGRRPKFIHEPLILIGHGVRLRVDRGTLLVRGGLTHYPQQQEEWRFFPKDRCLPSRIVILDGDGGITFDALEWLAVQGVPLAQINWRGEVVSIGGGFGYAADLEILRAQLEIQDSTFSLSFATHVIETKIKNSAATIQAVFFPSPSAQTALGKLEERIQEIKRNPATVSALLGVEGNAAAAYFRCWHSFPLKWKGVGKKPIPDDWHRIGSRMTDNKWNKFATHPINAMLNYAYGMLENQVRGIILAMGFDPTIGCLHAYERNRSTLVFDLMEPMRPIIDRKILNFVKDHIFSPSDFTINQTGVCKLHPQFARVIIKMVLDIPEIETATANNLKKLLALYPATAKRSGKNIGSYRAKLVGKRE